MLNFWLLRRRTEPRVSYKSICRRPPVKVLALLCLAAATLAAQDSSSDSDNDYGTRRVTAASQFFDHDFVNVFAFANGIWDSRVPVLTNQSGYGSGVGWEAGAGIELSHQFKDGGITLSYQGSYRDYPSSTFHGGTQQSLALAYSKRLNKRWTFGSSVSGGILSYGSSYYGASALGTSISTNPFSSESRFLDAGVSMTYTQSRRLSYVFSASYFLTNYSYAGSFSSYGVSGSGAVYYRLTARTTIGGSYSHTYYVYSQSAGRSNIDTGSLTLSHRFPDHWQLDLSGGVSKVHSQGTISELVSLIFDGQTVTGYLTGPYNRNIYSPSYQGYLTRGYRRSSFALGGGQNVAAGNGTFLASRSQFGTAIYSISGPHRSSLGFGVSYIRLSSLANSVSQSYSTFGASASYGINLIRYLNANARYDFLHYDGLFSYSGLNESRISVGLSLSSKSVPITLF
jgi:hypothetical protein